MRIMGMYFDYRELAVTLSCDLIHPSLPWFYFSICRSLILPPSLLEPVEPVQVGGRMGGGGRRMEGRTTGRRRTRKTEKRN